MVKAARETFPHSCWVQHLSHHGETDPPAFAESPGVAFLPQPGVQPCVFDIRKFLIFLELKDSVGLGWEDAEKPQKPLNPFSVPSEHRTPAWLPLMGGFRGHPEAQQGFTTAEHPKALYPGGAMCPSSFTSLFHSLLGRHKPS